MLSAENIKSFLIKLNDIILRKEEEFYAGELFVAEAEVIKPIQAAFNTLKKTPHEAFIEGSPCCHTLEHFCKQLSVFNPTRNIKRRNINFSHAQVGGKKNLDSACKT